GFGREADTSVASAFGRTSTEAEVTNTHSRHALRIHVFKELSYASSAFIAAGGPHPRQRGSDCTGEGRRGRNRPLRAGGELAAALDRLSRRPHLGLDRRHLRRVARQGLHLPARLPP